MLQQDNPVDIQRRLPLLAGFIVLFVIVLIGRLWYLQAVKGEYYQDLAESNRIRPVKLRPPARHHLRPLRQAAGRERPDLRRLAGSRGRARP